MINTRISQPHEEWEYPHQTPIAPNMEISQADVKGVARVVDEVEEEVVDAATRSSLTRTMKMAPPPHKNMDRWPLRHQPMMAHR